MTKQECVKADSQLERAYALWYAPKPTKEDLEKYGKYDAQDKIASNLNKNFPIDTVKKFWANYLSLPKPSTMPFFHKVSLMRTGMQPFWSEPALHKSGGILMFTIDKEFADEAVDYILMAIIGDTLPIFAKTSQEEIQGPIIRKPNVLVGCSLTRRRKREFAHIKEWIDCHIYMTDTTDDVRLYQALMNDLEECVNGFKMTDDAKYHRFSDN